MWLTFSFEDQASRSALRAVDLEFDRPDRPEAMLTLTPNYFWLRWAENPEDSSAPKHKITACEALL